MRPVIAGDIPDAAVRIGIRIINDIGQLIADISTRRIDLDIQRAAVDHLCDILIAEGCFDAVIERRKHRMRDIELRINDRYDRTRAGISLQCSRNAVLRRSIRIRQQKIRCLCDADNAGERCGLCDQRPRKRTAEAVIECAVAVIDGQRRIICADAILHSLLCGLAGCSLFCGRSGVEIIRITAHAGLHDRFAGNLNHNRHRFAGICLRDFRGGA